MAAQDHPNDGWTFRTFREYVLAKFEQITALREADRITLNAAMAAADRAVAKAEGANEKRFEGVNEFRKTLSDQAAGFMQRAEGDARFQALNDKLSALELRIEKTESSSSGKRQGASDIGQFAGYVFGASGTFALLWTLFHR